MVPLDAAHSTWGEALMRARVFQQQRFGADMRGEFPHTRDMKWALVAFYVLLFVTGTVLSSIEFKFAAEHTGRKALWHFISGNLIGVLGPIALTLALRVLNPNVTYALCYGTAFAVLQLVAWRVFHQPLSHWQVAGIVFVGIGVSLLHMGART
jgi:multidrug transporter EmrE-like cation transporter